MFNIFKNLYLVYNTLFTEKPKDVCYMSEKYNIHKFSKSSFSENVSLEFYYLYISFLKNLHISICFTYNFYNLITNFIKKINFIKTHCIKKNIKFYKI